MNFDDRTSHDGAADGVGSQAGDAIAVLDLPTIVDTGLDDSSAPVEQIGNGEGDRGRRSKRGARDVQASGEQSGSMSDPTTLLAALPAAAPPATTTQATPVMAPHVLGSGDEWPTNRVLLRGRIENPKRKAMWVKGFASGGVSYQQRTLLVIEPGLDDDFPDLAPKKRIALLIPEGLPYAQTQILAEGEGKEPREGRLVSIVGRMVLETMRDPRYDRGSNFGGEMVTRLYVKVLEVRAIEEGSAAEVALVRINGTVEEVQRLNGPLNTSKFAPAGAQQYHQVTIVTCEKFARPERDAAPREVKTRVKVFVPRDLAQAEMLLVPGNQVSVEAEYLLTTAFLPVGHAMLEQIDPEKLEWLRSRPSDHLVVTNIIPGPDAKPLEGAPQIAERLLKRPIRRKFKKRAPAAPAVV